MTKKNFWAAALTFLATGVACAQSSVTLYGLIDVGINYVSSAQVGRNADGSLAGKSQVSMSDGAMRGLGGSRWGVKGSEDLGGGLSAVFTLENGFNLNNGTLGQGGAEFGRQAFVGLSTSFGTVTFGRQYDSEADFVAPYTPNMIVGISGALPGDVDGLGHTRRANNAIKYVSRSYNGLTFGGMYSLGGSAGDFTASQVWALGANYTTGAFSFGLGYYNGRDPNLASFGNNPNAGPATTNNMGSFGSASSAQSNPIYAGYASAHTFEIYSGGASYKIGPATVALALSHNAFRALGDLQAGPNPLGYHGNAVFNNGSITGSYFVTPTLQVGAGYTYTRGGGAGGQGGVTYQQGILGVQYFLSKRTEVYLFGVYQVAIGTDSLGQPAVANIELMTPSSTNHQFVGRAGIVQRF
ncbi:porin [Burkholderia lata]|uniref:Porin n=1 Tax=Burkholderia lata (strain ATCC 17760 / DSM 23089 / LMG 22485 / NCIMB 9086 / R18194 / 383) TaxID=482957 RepID=A0A6P2SUR9_BURL3|nr:porin [Burkholderia lata]VWC47285.1 porin [Burkholderia lata]